MTRMDWYAMVAFAGAGFFGSLVKVVLENDGHIVFPRLIHGNKKHAAFLELGFVGNALVGMATAVIVDNSIYLAFFSAVSGSYLIELLGRRVGSQVRRFRAV